MNHQCHNVLGEDARGGSARRRGSREDGRRVQCVGQSEATGADDARLLRRGCTFNVNNNAES